jgi:hypothetical protein
MWEEDEDNNPYASPDAGQFSPFDAACNVLHGALRNNSTPISGFDSN